MQAKFQERQIKIYAQTQDALLILFAWCYQCLAMQGCSHSEVLNIAQSINQSIVGLGGPAPQHPKLLHSD